MGSQQVNQRTQPARLPQAETHFPQTTEFLPNGFCSEQNWNKTYSVCEMLAFWFSFKWLIPLFKNKNPRTVNTNEIFLMKIIFSKTKNIKWVAPLYIFTHFFVWLNRTQPDSHACFFIQTVAILPVMWLLENFTAQEKEWEKTLRTMY